MLISSQKYETKATTYNNGIGYNKISGDIITKKTQKSKETEA